MAGKAGGFPLAGPSKGPDRERKPKNIIVKVLVTPVSPAVVLSGNPDAPSLLFAPFDKGGEKEKRFLLSVEMTKKRIMTQSPFIKGVSRTNASCMISAC